VVTILGIGILLNNAYVVACETNVLISNLKPHAWTPTTIYLKTQNHMLLEMNEEKPLKLNSFHVFT
jgi:hypothetical protein